MTYLDRRDPDSGMGQRSVTRDVPQLTLRAQFDLSTLDVDKRTCELVWTTGAPVLRGGFFTEPYWEELSLDPEHVRMGRLQSGTAPLLNSHRSGAIADILGVVESAQLGKGEGRAKVRFDSGADGADAMRRVGEGTLRNVSVGYLTFAMREVDSKDAKVPTLRAIDWEPFELSLLPIGADAGANTRSGGGMTPCQFTFEERAMADKETTLTPPITIAAPAGTKLTVSSKGDDAGTEEGAGDGAGDGAGGETAADARSLERQRVLGIQRVGRALSRPQPEIDAAVNGGKSIEAFRAASVDALAAAPPEQGGTLTFGRQNPAIAAGADARDKFMRCAEHLIYQRSGVAGMIVAHAKSRGETLVIDPGECRGLTMAELAREFLERDGVKTRGMDKPEMIARALGLRGGMNSTSDFTVLLENTLHKTLLAAYDTTPDTWRRFCKIGTVTDFRPHPRYRQGSFGVLEAANEAGEFKNATIPDGEKQSITASTKGRIVGITRQAIINDDMGAFSDIATRLGRAAAMTIEVDVYATLVANPLMGDGLALFHATHGNIGAGGAAITVATIDADRVLMAVQQDPAKNEYLELRPAVLVLPIGLGGQARVINQAQYDVDAKVNARNQEPNKVVGLYRDIVDTARLSGTTRYSFADPAIAPVIEVAFLNGQQSPYMEMQQGFRSDGIEWKVRHDYAVGAVDWRGVVRNPGV